MSSAVTCYVTLSKSLPPPGPQFLYLLKEQVGFRDIEGRIQSQRGMIFTFKPFAQWPPPI